MLSFLAPAFLVGAFAAALPLVLHLLKREPEPRVKFAAVKLLKQAPGEFTERRQLREQRCLGVRVALSAAAQSLAGRAGTIVVVTDLQETGWDAGDRASIPEGAKIEVVDVGELPPNLAVTSVRAQPDRVVATVRNAGPRARDARLHLTIDDRPAGDATVPLAPNPSAGATFAGPPRGIAAAVPVDDPDRLQAATGRY